MRSTVRTKMRFHPLSRFQWMTVLALALLLGLSAMASAQQPAATPPKTPAPDQTQTAPAATPAATAAQPADATTPATSPAADGTKPEAQSGTTPAPAASAASTPAPAPAAKGGKKPKEVKVKVKKVKPPPMVPVTVERGVLTVDGWTGKAALNYSIMDLKFIYMWAPGVGTAIVSSEPFPGAQLQGGAFNGHTLTVNVAGHTLQLASDRNLLSGGKDLIKPAYVALDTTYVPEHPNYPAFGYGVTSKAPYAWPASMASYTGDVSRAPPLPQNLLPPVKTANCPPAAATAAPAGTPAASAPAPSATAPVPAVTATGAKVAVPCSAAPLVMYPGKEAKKDQALAKKEKKNEKLDDSFK